MPGRAREMTKPIADMTAEEHLLARGYRNKWIAAQPDRNNPHRRAARVARTPEQLERDKVKAADTRANWTPEQRERTRTRMAAYRANRPPGAAKAASAGWWAARTPEQIRQYFLNQYGLTLAEYDEMFARQGGLCAMECGRPATCIDHCHDCEAIDRRGSVRGLLCRPCNVGSYLDDIDHLYKRLTYLRVHAATCLVASVKPPV